MKLTGGKSDRPALVIAAILIVAILVGEVVVYSSDHTDYSSDASLDGNSVLYDISADGTKPYSVVVSDNGDVEPMSRLYVFYDPDYASNYEDVDVSIGARPLDQEYYLEQFMRALESRGVTGAELVDADRLAELLVGDIESEESGSAGLLCISGALPDTIYTGHEGDLVLEWIFSGGRMYWLGNVLGAWYSTADGLVEVEGDYQDLFLGAQCLNTEGTGTAYSEISSNGYTDALSLQNNDVRYGVNPDRLPDDRRHLCIGFMENNYSSITFVQNGKGFVCVLGGDYSNYQRYDLIQVIAAGLGPESEIVAVQEGTVSGTASGRIEGVEGENLSAFIYLGGYYPVYSRLVWM